MKSLRRIVSLCTAGALAVGMTCDMASNGYASKSVISIENSPTGTSEELIANAKKLSGIKSPKTVDVYVRPEINKVYYVIDGDNFGEFDLV